MRVLLQRVTSANVKVDDKVTAEIGKGVLILVGVCVNDTSKDVEYLANKISGLRIFGEDGGFDKSVVEIGAEALVVSQFTLYGDVRKGRRPSFDKAAPAKMAKELYQSLIDALIEKGVTVCSGEFQKMMSVGLVNDGPVTIYIDSKKEE